MIVIVHGYEGSGEGHWQRWLLHELQRLGRPAVMPELSAPEAPLKDIWVSELTQIIDASPEPVTVVCHSLGCWALDHLIATRGTRNVERALLVAPPSPLLIFEPIETFLPPPCDRTTWSPIAARSLLVGSDNDEFSDDGEPEQIAGALGLGFKQMPGAGHINTASGFGAWPFALEWTLSSKGR